MRIQDRNFLKIHARLNSRPAEYPDKKSHPDKINFSVMPYIRRHKNDTWHMVCDALGQNSHLNVFWDDDNFDGWRQIQEALRDRIEYFDRKKEKAKPITKQVAKARIKTKKKNEALPVQRQKRVWINNREVIPGPLTQQQLQWLALHNSNFY